MEFKKLGYAECKRMKKIIEEFSERLEDDSLLTMITSEIKGDEKFDSTKQLKVGVSIFRMLYKEANDLVSDFLIGLIVFDGNEDELPFNAEILAMDYLLSHEDFLNFFSGALQVFKRIKTFLGK